ncbi:MAG: hypothetical protein RLZZ227_1815, partial [Pseudomonadota bacterium]
MARRTKSPYRRSRRRSPLWSLVLLLVGLSAYQYYDQGRITWHELLYAEAGDLLAQLQLEPGSSAPSTTSAPSISTSSTTAATSSAPEAAAPATATGGDAPEARMSGRV